jgi:hypothetical protein
MIFEQRENLINKKPSFNLREYLGRDLTPTERGNLSPAQISFIEGAKQIDFGYAYGAEERWSEIRRAEEIVIEQLALLAELIAEMEEGGFRVSVYAKKYNKEADTPGEILVMLTRNGIAATVYEKFFGIDLRDITSDAWDRERLRLAIRKAKAEIERQEKKSAAAKGGSAEEAEEELFKKAA